MHVEPAQLAAIARRLRNAASEATAVVEADIPRIFGRARRVEQLGIQLEAAGIDARTAAEQLRTSHPALAAQAARADALASAALVVRDTDPGDLLLRTGGLRDVRSATGAVRAAADTLDATHRALTQSVDTMLDELRAAATRAPDHSRAIDVAGIVARIDPARFGDRAPVASTLAWGRGDAIGRAAAALAEPFDDVEALRAILSLAIREPVDAATIRAGFEVTARTHGIDAATRMPTWLRGSVDALELTPAQRHELMLLASRPDREAVASHVLEELASARSFDDLELLRAAMQLPEPLAISTDIDEHAAVVVTRDTADRALSAPAREAVRSAWVELARESPARLRWSLDLLADRPQSAEVVRRRALLASEHPEWILGAVAGARPEARTIVALPISDGWQDARASALADAWEFFRSAGGDPHALVDAWRSLPEDLADDAARRAVRAMALLPDGVRPAGAVHAHDLLQYALDHKRLNTVVPGARRIVAMVAESAHLRRSSESIAAAHARYAQLLSAATGEPGSVDTAALAAHFFALDDPARDPALTKVLLERVFQGRADDAVRRAATVLEDRFEALRIAADPATDPRAIVAELRELLELPADRFDLDAARRVHVLASIPGDAAPITAGPARTSDGTIHHHLLHGSGSTSFDRIRDSLELERENLLLAMDRQELLRAGTTSDDVRAELRSILAGDGAPTLDQLRRLAVLDGLPPGVRGVEPYLPTRATFAARWRSNAAVDDPETTRQVALLRVALEAADDAASSGASRADHVRELADLLFRPAPLGLDAAQRRRVAMLLSMPEHVRPPLPEPTGNVPTSLAANALEDALDEAAWARSTILRTLADEVEDPVRRVVDTLPIVEGRPDVSKLDPQLAPTLFAASDQQLAASGIDRYAILASTLESTRGSGDKHVVASATHRARDVLGALDEAELGDHVRPLVSELRALLDRNVDRLGGRLDDGYGQHPDYAEHGRAIEIAALLHRIEGATTHVADGAESLAW